MTIPANTGQAPTQQSTYVFDNSDEEPTGRRFTGLPLVFDPGTIRHLLARGARPRLAVPGGRRRWWFGRPLAGRAGGSHGSVLATDIDTRFLDSIQLANLEVLRHDVGNDPLPELAFDLVHARLVLQHVPAREAALTRLVASLRHGGWLVIEDFDSRPDIHSEPELDPAEVLIKTHAILTRLMAAHGVDLTFARRLQLYARARPHGHRSGGARVPLDRRLARRDPRASRPRAVARTDTRHRRSYPGRVRWRPGPPR